MYLRAHQVSPHRHEKIVHYSGETKGETRNRSLGSSGHSLSGPGILTLGVDADPPKPIKKMSVRFAVPNFRIKESMHNTKLNKYIGRWWHRRMTQFEECTRQMTDVTQIQWDQQIDEEKLQAAALWLVNKPQRAFSRHKHNRLPTIVYDLTESEKKLDRAQRLAEHSVLETSGRLLSYSSTYRVSLSERSGISCCPPTDILTNALHAFNNTISARDT